MSTSPNLASFLASLRSHKADVSVQRLETLLKRQQIWGARRSAVATAHLLITVVAECKPKDAHELLQRVRNVARKLVKAQPQDLSIGNVARRVLGLIREASEQGKKTDQTDVPSHSRQEGTKDGNSKVLSIGSIKEDVLDGMRELLEELDQADKQISEYALEHVHPEDTVLVHGSSLTIQKFLLDAAKRRKFTVIQVEAYPNEHELVQDTVMKGAVRSAEDAPGNDNRLKRLTAAGVNVIYVPDSAIFAVMPRVGRVFLSAQGLFPNGGSIASAGSKVVTKAAKFYRIPVMVVGAIYRLSLAAAFDIDSFTSDSRPSKAVPYADGDFLEDVEVVNGVRDYVAPEDTSLVITNIGGFSPDYLGRIAADHYREQDTEL